MRSKKKTASSAHRAKRTKKSKTTRKAGRKAKASTKKVPAGKASKKKRSGRKAKKGKKNAGERRPSVNSALGRLQPELEKALSSLLRRKQRHLSKLPQSAQLKLLEVEAGGFTYTLNRLRPPPNDSLTHRQKQIARQVSQGLSNKEIGEKLQISSATVAAHLRTIFTKLRVRTRTALAKHALAYY